MPRGCAKMGRGCVRMLVLNLAGLWLTACRSPLVLSGITPDFATLLPNLRSSTDLGQALRL